MHFSINGEDGKKLADLDLTGAPPSETCILSQPPEAAAAMAIAANGATPRRKDLMLIE